MSEPRDRGPSVFSLLFRSPLSFFVLCSLTFMATLLLLGGASLDTLTLWDSRQTRLWNMLLALHPTVWVASLLIVSGDLAGHHPVWPRRWRGRLTAGLCTLLILGMTAVPIMIQFIIPPFPSSVNTELVTGIPAYRAKMFLLNLCGTVIGTLHACGMFSVHVQLIGCLSEYRARPEATGVEELEQDVLHYQRLRSQLKRFLTVSAAIIGLTIVGASVFRGLLLAAYPSLPEVFPASTLMSFGLYLTGLLASVYLPAHKTLTDVGQMLTDRLLQRSLGPRSTWKQWLQEQQAIQTYLGLQGSALQELQQVLTLLTPFLASLSSLASGLGT